MFLQESRKNCFRFPSWILRVRVIKAARLSNGWLHTALWRLVSSAWRHIRLVVLFICIILGFKNSGWWLICPSWWLISPRWWLIGGCNGVLSIGDEVNIGESQHRCLARDSPLVGKRFAASSFPWPKLVKSCSCWNSFKVFRIVLRETWSSSEALGRFGSFESLWRP